MPAERRHPLRNFFIQREIQIAHIKSQLAVVVTSTLLSGAIILAFYYWSSRSGYFYFMSENLDEPLVRKSLVGVALPGLLAALLCSLAVGFWMAFAASRRMAVLLHKLEVWSRAMAEGDLSAPMTFREKEDYLAIMDNCNRAGGRMRDALSELNAVINDPAPDNAVAPNDSPRERLEKARGVLSRFRFGR